jgi:7-keto-8-aminopelargonate synthetase-like enzyme
LTDYKNWQRQKIIFSHSHQEIAADNINELVVIKKKDKVLTLKGGEKLTEFISCSYLGLDENEKIKEGAMRSIHDFSVMFSSARTRVKMHVLDDLDILLNKIFCNSYTTTFSTLHLSHLSILPLLASGEMPSFYFKTRTPYFILDHRVHSSIQVNRGLLLQFGEVELIDFNNIELLEHHFKHAYYKNRVPIAIADGVGSMGGLIPLKALFEFIEKYNGFAYIDDAHGTSVTGQYGCGYVLQELGAFHPRMCLALSLSKAFGTAGGVLALPTRQDELFIKRYGESYIFGGPPTNPAVGASIESAKIHLSSELKKLQNKLWLNVDFMDRLVGRKLLNYGLRSPIRGIAIGNELETINKAVFLRSKGFLVTTAMYPTVPRNKGILRIAISASHTSEQITQLAYLVNTFQSKEIEVSFE